MSFARVAGLVGVLALSSSARSEVLEATPATLASRIASAQPGDVVRLTPGVYSPIVIAGKNGRSDAWITIEGPEAGGAAVLEADPGPCCNTVELVGSSFVRLRRLTIDNRGVKGPFAVSAKSGVVHHVRIEENLIRYTNADQDDCAISTKVPTFGWEIRGNVIAGAGTGMYLGRPDGTAPFIGGLIEHNVIVDPVGYDIEIKHQNAWPVDAGLPAGVNVTVLRHNVFAKSDRPSPSGDRPNVVVDGVPEVGPGANDRFEIYGNLFFHNPRESLLQVSGRVSIHDNLFVDAATAPAVRVMDHNGKRVKLVTIYRNTFFTPGTAVRFTSSASEWSLVAANLFLSSTATAGTVGAERGNLVFPLAMAASIVRRPIVRLPELDLTPIDFSRVSGSPVALAEVSGDLDFGADFNGVRRTNAEGRGAYFTELPCAWTPSETVKWLGGCADGGSPDAGPEPLDAGHVASGSDDAGAPVDSTQLLDPTEASRCGCDVSAPMSGVLGIALLGLRGRSTWRRSRRERRRCDR